MIIPYSCANPYIGSFVARAAKLDNVAAFNDEVEALRILNSSSVEGPLPFPELVEEGEAIFDNIKRPYVLVPRFNEGFELWGAADYDKYHELQESSRVFMAQQMIKAVMTAHKNGIYGIELKPNAIMWNVDNSDPTRVTDAAFIDWNCIRYVNGKMKRTGLGTVESARNKDLIGLARLVATCLEGVAPNGTEVDFSSSYTNYFTRVVEKGLRGEYKDVDSFYTDFWKCMHYGVPV